MEGIHRRGLVVTMHFPKGRVGGYLILWFLTLAAATGAPGRQENILPGKVPFVIDRSQFSFGTIFEYGDSYLVYESRCIPGRPGQLYGWRIRGLVGLGDAWVRETLTLPSAPKTWGEQGNEGGLFLISDDRTSCFWERNLPVMKESVGNCWEFAEGDPRGIYELQVSVAGVVLDELLFFID